MRAEIVLFALVACGHKAAEPEEERGPAEVTCKAVVKTQVEDAIELTGVIAAPPKRDAVISSPVAGRVGRVAVEEGDMVAQGALIAVVEDPALPAGSLEAKAGVASARAAKVAGDAELARQERLVNAGIGARRDLDEARAKAAAAAAELDAATARSGLANQQLSRRELRAPHAGVVLHLWKRTGESVDGTAATPIAEIADVSVLELRAQLPPAALVPVKENMPATVQLVGGSKSLRAKVIRVAPAVDPSTLLATVRLEIEITHETLLVGSAASARIVIAEHPGLLVPAAALRRSAAGVDELVACEGGVAKVHAVTLGQRSESGVEIATGIAATDKIVIDHVIGIEDGQPLVQGK